jgi:quinol-cytochrome oxidoreductase complex cytochrome b subunit
MAIYRWLETRISIRTILDAVKASQPADYHSPLNAPPFSLGRLSLMLVILLILSGFGLLLFYEPTAEGAAASLATLHSERPIGWLIHNTHRWSALLLLVAAVLHALRAWLIRAYQHPRDLNWWLGLGLLLLVIGMGGTGYLLRWDIKAFALMDLVVSNFSDLPVLGPILVGVMLGGTELDQIPLYRGYAFHVWLLPLLLFTAIALHLLVSWRQGLAERPRWWEELQLRLGDIRGLDFLPGAALLVTVIVLSAVTPHEGAAGPVDRSTWPHPDWILSFYYLPFWFFDRTTRALGTVVVPAALLTLLFLIPRLAPSKAKSWIRIGLVIFGIGGVLWMFGQISFMGYAIPMQGCAACHREEILGGAPTSLSEFKIHDPDWLVFHLREPEISILTPYLPPETLP